MTRLAANSDPGALSCAEQEALVRLLDDDEPFVRDAVERRILGCGEGALSWLKPHLLASNPALRKRVIRLVEMIGRQEADNRFLSECLNRGEDLDLEGMIWGLARTRYPGIHVGGYQAILEGYARDLAEVLPARGRAAPVLAAVNRYLFEHLHYAGNEEDYIDADNSYFNRVMDRRRGNPVSLCLLYLFVGRRLRLPLSGMGIPGHFLCRYQSTTETVYVDAARRGRILSRADCMGYWLQLGCGRQGGIFALASPRRILMRVCSNLFQVYHHRRDREETQRIQRYLVALGR